MILLAFDFDGVFDEGGPPGPLSHAWLVNVASFPGVVVKVVSESGNNHWTDFPAVPVGFSRRTHLSAFRADHQLAAIRLYISDNKDYAEADAAGFVYIEAAEFAKGVL